MPHTMYSEYSFYSIQQMTFGIEAQDHTTKLVWEKIIRKKKKMKKEIKNEKDIQSTRTLPIACIPLIPSTSAGGSFQSTVNHGPGGL